MADGQLIVVALGGNAISRPGEEGRVNEQFANSQLAARHLADLVEQGHRLVITHGNGPQIGNFLLRNRAAAQTIYPLPMEVAVAHVQGGMGFMIGQTLTNELMTRGLDRVVTAIVTTILVDADDPAFSTPTKPIGRAMSRAKAHRLRREEGWTVSRVSPDAYRRVVSSPVPKHIMEIDIIRRSVDAGDLLVVCGGGGIPVYRNENGSVYGLQAVIDKDLASSLLATELGADTMLILTNVDRVSINFGRPGERAVDRATVAQAQDWLDEGQFPAGSMGPKIQAAVQFLRARSHNNARVIIGPLERAAEAVAGKTGTCITKT